MRNTKQSIRTFKVASDLKSFVENILKRRGIEFTTNSETEISAAISGQYFHRVIIRARCEKDDYEQWGLIVETPRIHISERDNRTVLNELGETTCCKVVGETRE